MERDEYCGGFVSVGVHGTNLFSLLCCAWKLSLLIVYMYVESGMLLFLLLYCVVFMSSAYAL